MKLQFKHQKFQADAANAVCDVFAGQPYLTPTYMMDRGTDTVRMDIVREPQQEALGKRRQEAVR